MLSEKDFLSLVGRYQLQEEGQAFLDDEQDLHIIAVDPGAKEALVDFKASPEWMPLQAEAQGVVLVNSKYQLDSNNMTYTIV